MSTNSQTQRKLLDWWHGFKHYAQKFLDKKAIFYDAKLITKHMLKMLAFKQTTVSAIDGCQACADAWVCNHT